MKIAPLLSLALAAGAAALPAAPAFAQRSERVLTIFGDEKCPSSNGEEIVVCRRLPENERYRIPLDLRDPDDPRAATWAARAKSFEYVGASGIASCSPAGSGGATGCFREMIRQAREENAAKGDPGSPVKF